MHIRDLTPKALGAGPRAVDLSVALLVQAAVTMPFVGRVIRRGSRINRMESSSSYGFHAQEAPA
ncbi:hypothetical protein [Streptomyces sp. NBC_01618]|uniref:hypothetical protein n=1 Tax=Streptomyces sp. NBC_01618 TaxID=2975900 RepID=UPI00386C9613|nr:hypothetical protein OH735_27520 [Streptomyces sp. NBC_01618]